MTTANDETPEQRLIRELVEVLGLLVVDKYSAEYVIGKYISGIYLNSEEYSINTKT